jgi:hypothetical protein
MDTMDTLYEARLRAYGQLQGKQKTLSPGSVKYEIVEHALDLALKPRRRTDEFLVRNLLRDSRRILARQAANRRKVQLDDAAVALLDTSAALVETSTPESLLRAKQLLHQIRAAVMPFSRHAARVLEGLVIGESLAETAADCGISTVRVNQLRRLVRDAAMIWRNR